MRKVFEILKWDFNPNVEYEIITFIINSNRTLVGLSINDIPIIDKEILLNYFRKINSQFYQWKKMNKLST